MAKRGSTGGASGFGDGIKIDFSLEHPDFAQAKLDRSKTTALRAVIATFIVDRIVEQIPIKTGQLRGSYRQNATLGRIGPLRTGRFDSSLDNHTLAVILHAKGHLDLQVSGRFAKEVNALAKKILTGGKGPLVFRGLKVLK